MMYYNVSLRHRKMKTGPKQLDPGSVKLISIALKKHKFKMTTEKSDRHRKQRVNNVVHEKYWIFL